MDLCLKLTPDTFVLIKPCMWSTSQGRGGHIQFKVKGLKVCVWGGGCCLVHGEGATDLHPRGATGEGCPAAARDPGVSEGTGARLPEDDSR